MLDIGWTELLVIGALALIVVGPKDLPGMLRNAGRLVAKARGMAREFQGAMEDAARQADLGDVADLKRDVSKWSSGFNPASPSKMAKSLLDDDGDTPKKADPAPNSLDAADAAENAAWEAEQAAKAEAAAAETHEADSRDALAKAEAEAKAAELRLAEARAAAEAARLDKVNRSAAELEAELARDDEAETPRPAAPGA